MVTRLLLSLRKAGDPETLAQWNMDNFTRPRVLTMTRCHSTSSDTQDSATMHTSQTEILDSVLELSYLDSQDEGALDGEV